ncbi:MAG TPA: Yip1 family protein [Thermoanaerobaculia bacterium]|nr:Yip1 family protein [Thermoanaerobaculia bacterium]
MTTGLEQDPQSLQPPPPPEKPNPWQRIVGVFLSPTETFRSIVRQPDWVVPLLVIVVMTIIGTVLLYTHVDFAAPIRAQLQEQNPNLSPDQAERAVRFGMIFARVIFALTPFISIGSLIVTAAILLVAMRMFGGEGEFKPAFSVTLYSWMPFVILAVITWAVLLSRGQVPVDQLQSMVRSNFGFLADAKREPVMFALLVSIDVFTAWVISLMVIGFAEVSKMTRAKVAAIIITMWVILTLFKVGFASLGALMKKARA